MGSTDPGSPGAGEVDPTTLLQAREITAALIGL
jgi:hypothetical protein